MLATAHISYDRAYFELQYDEWLRHRSKLKRYEVWFAVALTVFGIWLALAFQHQWLVGALFASAGVYEVAMVATHKGRWLNARVSTVQDDKSVKLKFDSAKLTSSSKNGAGEMLLSGFAGFTAASHGFFLVPYTGVSIYVPEATIDPSDSYPELVQLLSKTVGQRSRR